MLGAVNQCVFAGSNPAACLILPRVYLSAVGFCPFGHVLKFSVSRREAPVVSLFVAWSRLWDPTGSNPCLCVFALPYWFVFGFGGSYQLPNPNWPRWFLGCPGAHLKGLYTGPHGVVVWCFGRRCSDRGSNPDTLNNARKQLKKR